ncbi:hypothetical protein FGB62_46g00 [Gracilaria domingensis]|nr:hypothetical protein FGB62_46g00 [Gracilaria domingensis]
MLIFNASEEWPTNGEGTFDLPPLESAANPTVINWRGVRFADVTKELYYEKDGLEFSCDFKSMNVCARTGESPDINPTALQWLYKHTPVQVKWENLTAMSGLYYIMAGISLREAVQAIGDSESNIYWDIYAEREHKDSDVDSNLHTLTLAVFYAHKGPQSQGLLKANEFQIAQLEDLLSAIRENPPSNTKYVRLWTDGVNSAHLATSETKERSKWIFHGLLPYAVFPVAWLSSGEEKDEISMWSTCEQILADGALGCLFSISQSSSACYPLIGKEFYCNRLPATAVKTVGNGLSINQNLAKLAAAIHSGVLDDTVTYHIADAQNFIRLSYYMTRKADVSMAHAVNCEECLHATFREHQGFLTALHECCDLYRTDTDEDLQLRLNKTWISYPYPKVRARRGYVDWHGIREFAPGAGRFAKLMLPVFAETFKENLHIVAISHNGLPSLE